MPLYDYQCEKCGSIVEVLCVVEAEPPQCCEQSMIRLPSFPALVKMKGEGGFPSKRKQYRGTAPYTSRSTRPNVDVVNERIYGKS